MIIGVALVLMFWQFNKNKGGGGGMPGGGPGGFAGRGALGGGDDFDMDAFKAMQQMGGRRGGGRGGGGGGGGGRASNAEFDEAYQAVLGAKMSGRGADFSRDRDVAGSRFEEIDK